MIVARIAELGLKYDSRSKVTVADAETLQHFIQMKDYDDNFKAVVATDLLDAVEKLSAEIMSFQALSKLKDHIQFRIMHEEIRDSKFWLKLGCVSSNWYGIHMPKVANVSTGEIREMAESNL